MNKRACIFVDGENFRHTIRDLFEDYDGSDYLPRQAKWGEFFDWLATNSGIAKEPIDRVRTYWYVVQHIDFSPHNLASTRDIQELKSLLERWDEYRKRLRGLEGKDLEKELLTIKSGLLRTQNQKRNRFEGWIRVQDAISYHHAAIEFRRSGTLKCRLFENRFYAEKGVDVKLATDLIVLKDIYDIAIIVSGDQDFVPAVRAIKDFGKRVVNVPFLTKDGKLLPGGARRLNNETDSSFSVPFDEFRKYMQL